MQHKRALALAAVLTVVIFGFSAYLGITHAQVLNSATRQQLMDQLDSLTVQADAYQKQIDALERQKSSLKRDLALLDAQIAQAKLAIQSRNLTIRQLSLNIQQKEDTISGLNNKLQNEYESLAAILREMNQLDTTSSVIVALTAQSLSEFFADIDQFGAINEQMQRSFMDIQTNKQLNEEQKSELEGQLQEETQLRQVQQLQQQQLTQQEKQKNQILTATKGEESTYQALLAKNQQTAAQIRAALFQLTGTKGIPFAQALQYANLAQQKTGIRPAFLLGVIAEESNLGQNIGTGNWQTDMYQCYINLGSPTAAQKQKTAFLSITSSLGLDPYSMPVSKKPWYGCGGAMGPAQFIPTTWALYAGYTTPSYSYSPSDDRVGRLTGNQPPSPWSPEDAFMAAALYLTDSGAALQTPNAEFKAAMCYLAGCGKVNNKALQFYGNDVAKLAIKYQCQIDIINGNSNSKSCSLESL